MSGAYVIALNYKMDDTKMEIKLKDNNIILTDMPDFELRHIFDCGQCFRFNQVSDEAYLGVAFGRALKISQMNGEIIFHDTSRKDFDEIWFDFFDLGRDYGQIKRTISTDEKMLEATKYGYGIRILKQELWETIVSFIISASNNIPRIKGIVERLCQSFGDKIEYMGDVYYSFPSPETISQLSLDELSIIRAGFRDKYILDAANKVVNGEISLEKIMSLSTMEAKNELMKINGVGNKVSDCILLFGLNRADSFPVDVWIKRIMEYCYFDKEVSIKAVSELAAQKFGELGGFAQQYLFFWARDNKIGTKE